MSEIEISKPVPHATEDARALLARLYHEIGTSAVAAALQMCEAPEANLKAAPDLAVALRGDDIAA
jgi:hypothetical protein